MTNLKTAMPFARALAVLLSVNLGACFGGGGDDQFGEALELGLGVATLGLAVAGGANAGYRGGNTPVVQGSGNPSTFTVPRGNGNGYSQKGAFDDCAKLYASAGAKQQEAECRRRSANMSSLR